MNGADLDTVRSELRSLKAELSKLSAIPASPSNLKALAEKHVASLVQPVIRFGSDWLNVEWDKISGVSLAALIAPDALVARIVSEVERQVGSLMAPDERQRRAREIEREKEELHRVEEVLVAAAIDAGEAIERTADAPPAAILGVRVAAQQQTARRVLKERAA